MDLTNKILKLLKEHDFDFQELDHDNSITCEQSAKARGESLAIGGKTILFKGKKEYSLFTLSAAKEVDSNKVRKILGSQRLRFATDEELADLCHVVKGALPPLGKALYPFEHFIDKSVLENEKIAFNAGILTKSIIMNVEDYLELVNATICEFSK